MSGPGTPPAAGNGTVSIRALGLVKRRGGEEVLRGIDLEVERGEVAAVIGPSGGGKSTFLRCLIGLETLDGGAVEVEGARLEARMGRQALRAALAEVRRRAGMVFQQFNLFPHLSVLGNVVEAPMRVLGLPRGEAEPQARPLLERVGMGAYLDRMPGTLSGGQAQRAAIARALAMRPRVLLLDEPTSALDPRMAAEVRSVMADLARSGQTMLLVTHDLGFARAAARRVHVFEDGRVIESGPPEEILGAPRDPRTRRFLAVLGEG
jgi:ABC-type polar amino acid transport system ATPase subunit